MASIINASTSSGLVQSADTSGEIELQNNGTTRLTVNASGVTIPTLTTTTVTGTIVQGTAVASTSGTSIDFTSLPSWVKRVTVLFSGVSVNSTGELLVQLGTSGGIVSSGYVSTSSTQQGTSDSNTTGFISYSAGAAADAISGQMIISLINSNTWVESFMVKGGTSAVRYGAGNVDLGGALTQVRITTTTGTDTFDAGTINIQYEG